MSTATVQHESASSFSDNDSQEIPDVQDLTIETEKRLMQTHNRLEVIRLQEDRTQLLRYNAVLAGLIADIDGLPLHLQRAASAAMRIYVDGSRRILRQIQGTTDDFLRARHRQNDAQMRFSNFSQQMIAWDQPEHRADGKRLGFFSRLFSWLKPGRGKRAAAELQERKKVREAMLEAVKHIREDIDTQTDAMDAYTRLRAEIGRNLVEMTDIVNGYRQVGSQISCGGHSVDNLLQEASQSPDANPLPGASPLQGASPRKRRATAA